MSTTKAAGFLFTCLGAFIVFEEARSSGWQEGYRAGIAVQKYRQEQIDAEKGETNDV